METEEMEELHWNEQASKEEDGAAYYSLGMMADHSSRWARFKKQYQKYSKAYWTPEVQLKRTIETGDCR